jgi:EmrB/QacA subfamily drug resistance transporter
MSGLISRGPPGQRTGPAWSSARRPGPALLAIATAQFMVALDTTIVNVALPHIQQALGLSGSGLEWVVNAYAVTFGGVLLIGGRAGDLLGRRRVFVGGLLLFSAASLAGGLASSQAWLLAARAVQGTGAAITAPAALALIATTFPEGRPRNRAMGVYSATSAAGGTIGLLAGGLLSTYASWRWVLYVNVPIGVAVALAVPLVLAEAPRQRGRFGLPGAIAGAGGVAALVYGLSAAAASPDGTSHWSDRKVIASLTAAAVLLIAFALIQARSQQPLVPARLLRDGDRCAAYLIMVCAATAMSAVFFFLTVFQEEVWGYSPLRTGASYLPMTAAVLTASGAAARLVTRIATRPLLLVGAAAATGGLYWLSRLSEHGSYAGAVLGPTLVVGWGLGLLSVPLSLAALSRVRDSDSGVASSLLSAGQQVGGSIGLAVLGTLAWTVAAGRAGTRVTGTATRAGRRAGPGGQLPAAIYQHALATGFGRAFLAAAAIMVVALAIAVIRIPAPRGTSPGAGSRHRRRARGWTRWRRKWSRAYAVPPRHSRPSATRRGSSRERSRARHRKTVKGRIPRLSCNHEWCPPRTRTPSRLSATTAPTPWSSAWAAGRAANRTGGPTATATADTCWTTSRWSSMTRAWAA